MASYTPRAERALGLRGQAMARAYAKPKKKPVVKAPKVVNPLDALYRRLVGQTKTQAQLEAEAARLGGAQTTSSLDLVRSESARLRADAERRRQAMTNAMMAAAGENQKMAPSILAGYQSAASGLGNLAGFVTGATGDAVRSDIAAQSEALARVGQAGPNLDASQQQGVEMYTGGYLPASSLAALGANANQGFLREVAAERMGAVEEPWRKYEEVIASLDEDELSQLTKIETTRPDLVAKILDNLMENQTGITKSILDIEQERRQIAAGQAKIRQATAELNYKYQTARQKATTAAEKLALDRWYKAQQVKINAANVALGRGRLQVSQGHLAVSQQNAATNAAGGGTKFKSLGEIMASVGRSYKSVPEVPGGSPVQQSQERNKIRDAVFESYKYSFPERRWPELKRAITKWAYKLPIKKAAGKTSKFFAPK